MCSYEDNSYDKNLAFISEINLGYPEIRKIIEKSFLIEDSWIEENKFVFNVKALDPKLAFLKIKDELMSINFLPFLRLRNKKLTLIIMPKPLFKKSKWIWNLILLLMTVATTIFVGYQMSMPLVEMGLMKNPWNGAVTFSIAIISILGCHELGHKFMASRRGVEASLPYFIPVPFFVGTMGAVIETKTPAPNRDALFDLGVAGPIFGLLILIPTTLIGLYLSYPIAPKAIPPGSIVLPVPLIFIVLSSLLGPKIFKANILFHPVAFASWVGMLVTMLNLMPVGMLDGGHISRAIFGERNHKVISFIASIITFALGWWLMAILMIYLSLAPHPGPLDDVSPLERNRKILSIFVFIILVLCAIPSPEWKLGF
ncbi:MAG: site-2 protease family protein [Candidatus Bathyarchaeia archaeon]